MLLTIKPYLYLNCVLMLNWIVWNRTFFIKIDLALNNIQRLICHKIQPTNQPTLKQDIYIERERRRERQRHRQTDRLTDNENNWITSLNGESILGKSYQFPPRISNWIEGSPNCPGDMGSIPGCVIPKTLKMVLNTFMHNTQQYKLRIKGKVEQSRERSNAPNTSV